jgi:hypothetical protein
LTSALRKYKLPLPALITRHVSLVSSACEIVIGDERLFRYHHPRIAMCLRNLHIFRLRAIAPMIR